jgi:integrase
MGIEMNSSKYLLPNEIDDLMSVVKLAMNSSPRDSLLIELALKCGGRACELIPTYDSQGKNLTGIRKADLNPSFKTVHIRALKGSSNRDVGLSQDLFTRLVRYAADVEGEYLFPVSYPRLVQIWNEYRTVKKTFHCLRHTFAITLYRKTKDVLLLKRAMGHKSINSTMVYTNIPITAEDFSRMAI